MDFRSDVTKLSSKLGYDEELRLITSINGYNIDTLDDVLYARSGYRDLEQFEESELKEF